mmetsp:Transcript_63182/g.206186  ORF Transcript_63182/g.206186 Transcript_63182/m.206186 type:complete len:209 (+) Transcript_63182:584-1210(+)
MLRPVVHVQQHAGPLVREQKHNNLQAPQHDELRVVPLVEPLLLRVRAFRNVRRLSLGDDVALRCVIVENDMFHEAALARDGGPHREQATDDGSDDAGSPCRQGDLRVPIHQCVEREDKEHHEPSERVHLDGVRHTRCHAQSQVRAEFKFLREHVLELRRDIRRLVVDVELLEELLEEARALDLPRHHLVDEILAPAAVDRQIPSHRVR